MEWTDEKSHEIGIFVGSKSLAEIFAFMEVYLESDSVRFWTKLFASDFEHQFHGNFLSVDSKDF